MATKKLTKAQTAEAVKEGEKELPGSSPQPGWEQWINTELGTPAASQDVAKLEKDFGGDPKADPKKKPAAKPQSASDAALQAISNYLTSSVAQGEEAVGEEGQELAQQNAAVTSTVDKYLTGTDSGSAAVNAAQQAYAQAYSAGEGLNSAAYANMAQANQQYVESAPMAPIIQLLTSGLGSDYYKQVPASLVATLPQDVRQALAAAGITEVGGEPISTKNDAKTEAGNALLSGLEAQEAQITNALTPTTATASTNPNTPGA